MKKINLLLLLLFASIQFAISQNAENHTSIGIYLGKNEYKGDVGNRLFNFNKFDLFGGLSIQKYLNPSFDLGLRGNYGQFGLADVTAKKWNGSLYFNYKLNNGYILKEYAFLAPFVTLGAGVLRFESASDNIKFNTSPTDFIVPVGAGFKLNFSKSVAMEYKYLYNFSNKDIHDMNTTKGANDFLGFKTDGYGEHWLGLVFSFGKIDSDGDGVADSKDNCPNTPAELVVDANGCPPDGDGDGVADYLDKCPTVAGLAQFEGCPDSDGDGVQDSEDKCPDTPAGVKVDANGCPMDIDGDGIPDYLDKCPTVKGVAQFNGCPDTDGDGIQDDKDKCPTVAGLAQFDGCPDSDGDGIPDHLDKCPNVPGIAANKGCPEVKAEVKKIFAQALQGIQFETAKADIKKQSFPILDKVVKVMNDNPEYNLEINGHTDSQGNDAYNQELSDKRASSVMQYLIDKGVSASRLTAKGFGESQPVADNKTAKGRYLNRRVEFKVNF